MSSRGENLSDVRPIIGTYGHGTHNDFVIIFDPENDQRLAHALTEKNIAAICNRNSGVGADGVIRISKNSDKWFMDYRNSDGSIAEMCGNGIRVMARYLVDRGFQKSGIFPILTRAGQKFLQVPDHGDISVNMGQVAQELGDIEVHHNGHTWRGAHISVGNPHAVVFVSALSEVGSLAHPPQVTPASAYPDGVNVEFVEELSSGELAYRVHARGSGETQSCGTGTCAVALAATIRAGKTLPIRWVIHAPGGRLEVEIDPHSNAILTGPAVLLDDHDLSRYLA